MLDQHARSVAGDEFRVTARFVGQQDGGLLMAQIQYMELAEGAPGEAGGLLIASRRAVSARRQQQAETGNASISLSRRGARRRNVIKVMPISSRRARLA